VDIFKSRAPAVKRNARQRTQIVTVCFNHDFFTFTARSVINPTISARVFERRLAAAMQRVRLARWMQP
jgi:hypothetical protein